MGTAKQRAVVLAILVETALADAAAAQGHVRRMLTVEDGLVHSHVLSIGEDRDGFLWFGTADGASRFDGLAFTNFRSGDGLPEGLVEAIYQAPDGPLYFGTTGGAALYEQGHMRPLADKLLAGVAVHAITGGPGGTIYFGTPRGVVARRPDGRSELLPTGDAKLRDHGVVALQLGRDGTLYAGSDDGLLIYRREKHTQVLPGRVVRSLDEGRNGTIYLGTNRWLALYRNGAVTTPGTRSGPDEMVRAVQEVENGHLILGTSSGAQLGRLPGPFQAITTNGPAWGWVSAVHQTRGATIYFATGQGIGIYQPPGAVESWTEAQELPEAGSIYDHPDGSRYFATAGSLDVLRNGKRSRLWNQRVTAIARAPGGALYLGTRQGLILYRNGVVRTWRRKDGLAEDHVYSLWAGEDGSLYVGTRLGLSILRDGHFHTVDRSNGLTDDTIYCILEDRLGRVYLSTRRGINVIDPSVSPIALQTAWTQADGLVSEHGLIRACKRDDRGRLWFGFYSGVSVIDPTVEKPLREPPQARISGVELVGRPVIPPPSGRPLALAGHQKDLTVSFLAVELSEPHRVRYRYRLSEADASWRETTTRAVHFSDLSPGDHTFEVAAAVGAGPWGEPARLRWKVPKPFYRSWWFFLLTLLAAMATAAAVATWRARYLLALERLRTAIAADLHDRIGSGLTEIAFLAETGERSRVAGIARELTGQLGDVVWLIHPRRDSLCELFLRLKDTYAELFAQEKAVFRTVDLSVFERVHLPVTCRQNLYLLFKEAFHNALRHAGCREIALDVALEGRQLEVTLTDDGRGFDPEAVDDEGDGLVNMQRRAAAIGGRLAIESAPGRGTVVRYTGPLR